MDNESTDVLGTLLGETEPLREKILAKQAENLFDESKILMIADLTIEQINYYFKLIIIDELFYKKYHVKITKQSDGKWKVEQVKTGLHTFTELFKKLLMLTISKGRESRKEIVEMFHVIKIESEKEKRMGLLRR